MSRLAAHAYDLVMVALVYESTPAFTLCGHEVVVLMTGENEREARGVSNSAHRKTQGWVEIARSTYIDLTQEASRERNAEAGADDFFKTRK